MTRTRIALISTTALASMLGAALPALAQAPAPAPMYAPAPPPPMMAPAPMPMPEPAPMMPVAPVVAPRAADDMTGSIGFGVGVVGGTDSLIAPNTGNLMMKYYMSDALAIMPALSLTMSKSKGSDASWSFAPSVLAMFNLLKGSSTRFDAGLGLALYLGKQADPTTGAVPADTTIGLSIPVQMQVEHFFTRWFSMGVGAGFHFIDFTKIGEGWSMELEVSNVRYLGSLFFYTD